MTDSTTSAAPRNTEEQLVWQLHDAAVTYEGTRIQGLLCYAGDVVFRLLRERDEARRERNEYYRLLQLAEETINNMPNAGQQPRR